MEILYCSGCGIRIRGSEPATHLLDRSYCPSCHEVPTPEPVPAPKPRRTPTRVRLNLQQARPKRGWILVASGAAAAGLLILTLLVPSAPAATAEIPAPPPVAARPYKTDRLLCTAPAAPAVVREPAGARDPVSRAADSQAVEPDDQARSESAADALHEEFLVTATVLVDEGRLADALAKIETFPQGLRQTRAWSSLDGLRRQIEIRRRTQAPR